MFHPLLGDPSKLKDVDLENKITDLNKKYYIAAQMGQGGAASQIIVALEMYRAEQNRRYIQSTKNINKKQGGDMDDLINID
jgi:hypothetical protein